jgi:protein required for attachment to host cells
MMIRLCTAVIDAARARLFVFERSAEPDGIHEQFVEREDLINPQRFQTLLQFAHVVGREIARFVRDAHAPRLVVCASPRMLGAIRRELGDLHRAGVLIEDIPRDVSGLSAREIRDHLVRYKLLPQSA